MKDINFKLGQGTINIWHARYGKFDPDICISFGASTPNPTCPEDMIDHTQALGLYRQRKITSLELSRYYAGYYECKFRDPI